MLSREEELSLERVILKNQPGLLFRAVSHGILPSRSLKGTKSMLQKSVVVILLFDFPSSSQHPKLYCLVVSSAKVVSSLHLPDQFFVSKRSS